MKKSELDKKNLLITNPNITNDVFYFRDFAMHQAPSGQRVNTDSCVFGALISPSVSPVKILDIGSGTGLLALMMAIRFPDARITAVEPEVVIAKVAQANFVESKWRDRIELMQIRAQDLNASQHGTHDFVFCNPPYFLGSTLSSDRLRAVARHTVDLLPAEIYDAMSRMMTDQGSAWLSFPEDRTDVWLKHGVASGLYQTHCITVRDNPEARPHMIIAGWSKSKPTAIVTETINYRTERQGDQSPWMKAFRDQWFPSKYNG